jgi:hypothetical protein
VLNGNCARSSFELHNYKPNSTWCSERFEVHLMALTGDEHQRHCKHRRSSECSSRMSHQNERVFSAMTKQVRPALQPGWEEHCRPRMIAQVKNETYTTEGPISYWNAYVAVTQMAGQGTFSDPRLGIDVKHSQEMVTSQLPALRAYQHSRRPLHLQPEASMQPSLSADAPFLSGRARAATLAAPVPITTLGHCTRRRDTGVDGAYAARTATRPTAQHRFVRCGNTRRTSTTAAPPRSPMSCRVTTGFGASVSPLNNSETLWSI